MFNIFSVTLTTIRKISIQFSGQQSVRFLLLRGVYNTTSTHCTYHDKNTAVIYLKWSTEAKTQPRLNVEHDYLNRIACLVGKYEFIATQWCAPSEIIADNKSNVYKKVYTHSRFSGDTAMIESDSFIFSFSLAFFTSFNIIRWISRILFPISYKQYSPVIVFKSFVVFPIEWFIYVFWQ